MLKGSIAEIEPPTFAAVGWVDLEEGSVIGFVLVCGPVKWQLAASPGVVCLWVPSLQNYLAEKKAELDQAVTEQAEVPPVQV